MTVLRRPFALEVVLLAAGALLVAIGSPVARAGNALLLAPLDAAVVLGAAALVVATRRLAPDVRRFAAAAAVLVLLIAVPLNRIPSAGELITSAGVAIVLLTLAGLRGHGLPRGRLLVPAAALAIGLGVVTVLAPDPYGPLRFAPFVLAGGSILLLLSGASGATTRRLLRFVLVVAVAEALLAVAEPFVGAPQLWAPAKINAAGVAKILWSPFAPDLARAQGTLGHPLALGTLLLVAVALLVRNAVGLSARARIAAAVPLAAGLAATGSRNSIAIAVLLVLAFLPVRRAVRIGAGLVALVAAVVVLVADGPVARLVGSWLLSGSASHRLGALDAVPGLLTTQPLPQVLFGNGWASSRRLYAAGLLQADGLRAVDNQFVLLLSQGGLLAVALFAVIVVVALMRCGPAMRPAVIAVVASCCFFDLLAWPATAALVALAVGVRGSVVASRHPGARARATAPRGGTTGRRTPQRLYSR